MWPHGLQQARPSCPSPSPRVCSDSGPLGFPGGSAGKEFVCNAGDLGSIPGLGRCPGEGNDTHSSILAWRITWTEEPGGLQAMGSQRVGHDRATYPSLSSPSSRWCHLTTSPSVTPFSSCPPSFPASGCFSKCLALNTSLILTDEMMGCSPGGQFIYSWLFINYKSAGFPSWDRNIGI